MCEFVDINELYFYVSLKSYCLCPFHVFFLISFQILDFDPGANFN